MSMIKIRKNAFLKIQTITAGSVGVICRSSSSRIDDGYDDEYRVSSCDEALTAEGESGTCRYIWKQRMAIRCCVLAVVMDLKLHSLPILIRLTLTRSWHGTLIA